MLKYRLVRQSVFDHHMGGRVYKYYARAIVSAHSTLDMIAAKIAETNTLTPTDVKAVIDGIWREIRERLRSGQIVELGELGHFRLSIENNGGSLTEASWKPDLIRRARIKFIPTKSMKSIAEKVSMERWHNPEMDNAKRAASAAATAYEAAQNALRESENMLACFREMSRSVGEAESRVMRNKYEAKVAEDQLILSKAEAALRQRQSALRKLKEAVLEAHGIDPAEIAIHLEKGHPVLEISDTDLEDEDGVAAASVIDAIDGIDPLTGEITLDASIIEGMPTTGEPLQFLSPDELADDLDDEEARHLLEKLQQRFAGNKQDNNKGKKPQENKDK